MYGHDDFGLHVYCRASEIPRKSALEGSVFDYNTALSTQNILNSNIKGIWNYITTLFVCLYKWYITIEFRRHNSSLLKIDETNIQNKIRIKKRITANAVTTKTNKKLTQPDCTIKLNTVKQSNLQNVSV